MRGHLNICLQSSCLGAVADSQLNTTVRRLCPRSRSTHESIAFIILRHLSPLCPYLSTKFLLLTKFATLQTSFGCTDDWLEARNLGRFDPVPFEIVSILPGQSRPHVVVLLSTYDIPFCDGPRRQCKILNYEGAEGTRWHDVSIRVVN